MEDTVVVINSDSEEDESKIFVKNAKLKCFKRLWDKANAIVFHHLSSDYDLAFPYVKFKNFHIELKKTLSEVTSDSTKSFIWHNLIQWLIAMKLSYSGIVDLKYDEKFNFILIDFMVEYINYKCKLNVKITTDYEIHKEINEILGILGIMFNGHSSYTVMTLVKIEVTEEYTNILKPIFNKILSDKYAHKSKEFISYLELILCFKQYKKLARSKEEREAINEIAVGKSMKSLGKNCNEECINVKEGILPRCVPPIDNTNRPFMTISDLIGHAIKKGNIGTRILLIKKSLDLDEAIEKYFIQYERKIYRFDPISLCSSTNLLCLNDNIEKINNLDNTHKTSNFGENNASYFSPRQQQQESFDQQSSLLGKQQQHLSNVCDINTKLININKKNSFNRLLDNKLINYNKISNKRNISNSSIALSKNNQICDHNIIEDIIEIDTTDNSSEENEDNIKNVTGITTKNHIKKSVPYKKSQLYKSKKIRNKNNNPTGKLLKNSFKNNNNTLEEEQTILLLSSSDDDDNKIDCDTRDKFLNTINNNNINRLSSRNSSIPSESDSSISAENLTDIINPKLRKTPQSNENHNIVSPLSSTYPLPSIQQQSPNNNINNRFSNLNSSASNENNATVNIKKLEKQHCIPGEVSSTTLLDFTISDQNEIAIASTSSAVEVHSASGNYEAVKNIREVGNIIKVNSPSVLTSPFRIRNDKITNNELLNYSDISSDDEDDTTEFSIARNLYSRIPKKYIREIEKAISSTSEINKGKGNSINIQNNIANGNIESSQNTYLEKLNFINQSTVIPKQNTLGDKIQFSFTNNTKSNKKSAISQIYDNCSTDDKIDNLKKNSVNCLAVIPYSPVLSNFNKSINENNLNVLPESPNIVIQTNCNAEITNSELDNNKNDSGIILTGKNYIPKQLSICQQNNDIYSDITENLNKDILTIGEKVETDSAAREMSVEIKAKEHLHSKISDQTIEKSLNSANIFQFDVNVVDKNKTADNEKLAERNNVQISSADIVIENKNLNSEINLQNIEDCTNINSEKIILNKLLPKSVASSTVRPDNDIATNVVKKSIEHLPISYNRDMSSNSKEISSKESTIKSAETNFDRPLKTYSKNIIQKLKPKLKLLGYKEKKELSNECEPKTITKENEHILAENESKTTTEIKENKSVSTDCDSKSRTILKESPTKISEKSSKQSNKQIHNTSKINELENEKLDSKPLYERSVPLLETPIQLGNKKTTDSKSEKPLKTYSKKSTFIRRIHKVFDDKTLFKKYSKHSTTIKIVKHELKNSQNTKEPNINKPLKTYTKAKQNNFGKTIEEQTSKPASLLQPVNIDLHTENLPEQTVEKINCELNFDSKPLSGIINSPQKYENDKEFQFEYTIRDIDRFDNNFESENTVIGDSEKTNKDIFKSSKIPEQINISQNNLQKSIEHKNENIEKHENSFINWYQNLSLPVTDLIELKKNTSNRNTGIPVNEKESKSDENLSETLSPDLPSTEINEILGTPNKNLVTVQIESKSENSSETSIQEVSFPKLMEIQKMPNKNIETPIIEKETKNYEKSSDTSLVLTEFNNLEKTTNKNINIPIIENEKKNEEKSSETLTQDVSLANTELIEGKHNTNKDIALIGEKNKNLIQDVSLPITGVIETHNKNIETGNAIGNENKNDKQSSETLPQNLSLSIKKLNDIAIEISTENGDKSDEKTSKTLVHNLSQHLIEYNEVEKTYNKIMEIPATEKYNETDKKLSDFMSQLSSEELIENQELPAKNIDTFQIEQKNNLNKKFNVNLNNISEIICENSNHTKKDNVIIYKDVADSTTNINMIDSINNKIRNTAESSALNFREEIVKDIDENETVQKLFEPLKDVNAKIVEIQPNDITESEKQPNNMNETDYNAQTTDTTNNPPLITVSNSSENINFITVPEDRVSLITDISEFKIDIFNSKHLGSRISDDSQVLDSAEHKIVILENDVQKENLRREKLSQKLLSDTDQIAEAISTTNSSTSKIVNPLDVQSNIVEKIELEGKINECKLKCKIAKENEDTKIIKNSEPSKIDINSTKGLDNSRNKNIVTETKNVSDNTDTILLSDKQEVSSNKSLLISETATTAVDDLDKSPKISASLQLTESISNNKDAVISNDKQVEPENLSESVPEILPSDELIEKQEATNPKHLDSKITESQVLDGAEDKIVIFENDIRIENFRQEKLSPKLSSDTDQIAETISRINSLTSKILNPLDVQSSRVEKIELEGKINECKLKCNSANENEDSRIIENCEPSETDINSTQGFDNSKITNIITETKNFSDNRETIILSHKKVVSCNKSALIERSETATTAVDDLDKSPKISASLQLTESISNNKDAVISNDKQEAPESCNESLLIERSGAATTAADNLDKSPKLSASLPLTDIQTIKPNLKYDNKMTIVTDLKSNVLSVNVCDNESKLIDNNNETVVETSLEKVSKNESIQELLPSTNFQNLETELNKDQLTQNIKIQQPKIILEIFDEILDAPLTPNKKLEQEISNYQNTPFKLRIKRRLSQCSNINDMFDSTFLKQNDIESEKPALADDKLTKPKPLNENEMMTSLLERIDEILDEKKEKCEIKTKKEKNSKLHDKSSLITSNRIHRNKNSFKNKHSHKISSKDCIVSKNNIENFGDNTVKKKELWMKIIGLGKTTSTILTEDDNIPSEDIEQKKISGRRKKSRCVKRLSSIDEMENTTSNVDGITIENLENDPFRDVIPIENFPIQNDNNNEILLRNNLELLLEAAKVCEKKNINENNNDCHKIKKIGRPSKKSQLTDKNQILPVRSTRLSCSVVEKEEIETNARNALIFNKPKKSVIRNPNQPINYNQPKKFVRFITPDSDKILLPEKSLEIIDSDDYTEINKTKKRNKNFTKVQNLKKECKKFTNENTFIMNDDDNDIISNCRPISPNSNSTDSDDIGRLVIDIPKNATPKNFSIKENKRNKKKQSLNKFDNNKKESLFKTRIKKNMNQEKFILSPPVMNFNNNLLVVNNVIQCENVVAAKLIEENQMEEIKDTQLFNKHLTTTNVSPTTELLNSPNQIYNNTTSLTSNIVHLTPEVDIISLYSNNIPENYENVNKSVNNISSPVNTICYDTPDDCQIMYPIVELCETDDILNIDDLEFRGKSINNNLKKTNRIRNQLIQKNNNAVNKRNIKQNHTEFPICVTSTEKYKHNENYNNNKFMCNNLLKDIQNPNDNIIVKGKSKSSENLLSLCLNNKSIKKQRKLSIDSKKFLDGKLDIDDKSLSHKIIQTTRVLEYPKYNLNNLQEASSKSSKTEQVDIAIEKVVIKQSSPSLNENILENNENLSYKDKISNEVKVTNKSEIFNTKSENCIILSKKPKIIQTISKPKIIDNISNKYEEKLSVKTDQSILENEFSNKKQDVEEISKLKIYESSKLKNTNINQCKQGKEIVPVKITKSKNQENNFSKKEEILTFNRDLKKNELKICQSNKTLHPLNEIESPILKSHVINKVPTELLSDKKLDMIAEENKIKKGINTADIAENNEISKPQIKSITKPNPKSIPKLGKDINAISNKLLEIASHEEANLKLNLDNKSTCIVTRINNVITENDKIISTNKPKLELSGNKTIIEKSPTVQQEEIKTEKISIENHLPQNRDVSLKQIIKSTEFNFDVQPIALLKVQNILEENLKSNLDSESILGQIENISSYPSQNEKDSKMNKSKKQNNIKRKPILDSELENKDIVNNSTAVKGITSKLNKEKNKIDNNTPNLEKSLIELKLISQLHSFPNKEIINDTNEKLIVENKHTDSIVTKINSKLKNNDISSLNQFCNKNHSVPLEKFDSNTVKPLINQQSKLKQNKPEQNLILKLNRRISKEFPCSEKNKLLEITNVTKLSKKSINLKSCFVDLSQYLNDPLIIKKKNELNETRITRKIVDNIVVNKLKRTPPFTKVFLPKIAKKKNLIQFSDIQKKISPIKISRNILKEIAQTNEISKEHAINSNLNVNSSEIIDKIVTTEGQPKIDHERVSIIETVKSPISLKNKEQENENDTIQNLKPESSISEILENMTVNNDTATGKSEQFLQIEDSDSTGKKQEVEPISKTLEMFAIDGHTIKSDSSKECLDVDNSENSKLTEDHSISETFEQKIINDNTIDNANLFSQFDNAASTTKPVGYSNSENLENIISPTQITDLNQNNEIEKFKINSEIDKNLLDCNLLPIEVSHVETGKALQKLSSMISKIKEITDLDDTLSSEDLPNEESTKSTTPEIVEINNKSKSDEESPSTFIDKKVENKNDEIMTKPNNEESFEKLSVENEPVILKSVDNNFNIQITATDNTIDSSIISELPTKSTSTTKVKNTNFISPFTFCNMPENIFDVGSDNSNSSEYGKITLNYKIPPIDEIIDPSTYKLNPSLDDENCFVKNQSNEKRTTKRKRKSRRSSLNKRLRLQNFTTEELRKIAETKKCFIKVIRYETVEDLKEQNKNYRSELVKNNNDIELFNKNLNISPKSLTTNSMNSSPTKSYESDSDTSSIISNTEDIQSTLLNVKMQLDNLKDLRFPTNDNVTDNPLPDITPITDVVNTSFKNSVDDISFVSSFDFSTPDWCSDTILDSITKDLTGSHHEYSTNNKGDYMISGKVPENSLGLRGIIYPLIDSDITNFVQLETDEIDVNNTVATSLNQAVNMNLILNESVISNKQQQQKQQILQHNLQNSDELLNYANNENQINPDDFLIPIETNDNYDISTDVGFDFQGHDNTLYDFSLLIENNNKILSSNLKNSVVNKNNSLTLKSDSSLTNNNFNCNNILHSTPKKHNDLQNTQKAIISPKKLSNNEIIIKQNEIENNKCDTTQKFVKEFFIPEKDLAEASSSKLNSDNLIEDSLIEEKKLSNNNLIEKPIIEENLITNESDQLKDDCKESTSKSTTKLVDKRRKSLVELSLALSNKSTNNNNQKSPEKYQTSESKLSSYPTPYWKVKNLNKDKQQSPPVTAITSNIEKSLEETSISSTTVTTSIISTTPIVTPTTTPVLLTSVPSSNSVSPTVSPSAIDMKKTIDKPMENNINIIPNCTKVNVMTISPSSTPLTTTNTSSTPFHMPVLVESSESFKKKKPIINSPNVTIIPKNLPQFNAGVITNKTPSTITKSDVVIDFIPVVKKSVQPLPVNNMKRPSIERNSPDIPLKRKCSDNEESSPTAVDIFDQLKNEPPINNVQLKLDQFKTDKNIIPIPKNIPTSIIHRKSPTVQPINSNTILNNPPKNITNGIYKNTVNNFTPSPTRKTPLNSPLEKSPIISPHRGQQHTKNEVDKTKYNNVTGFNKYSYRNPNLTQRFTPSPTIKTTPQNSPNITTTIIKEKQKLDKNVSNFIKNQNTNQSPTIKIPIDNNSSKNINRINKIVSSITQKSNNNVVASSVNQQQQQKEPILGTIAEIDKRIINLGEPKTYGQHKQLKELLKLKQLEEQKLKLQAELDAKILAGKQKQQQRLEYNKNFQIQKQHKPYAESRNSVTTNLSTKMKLSSTKHGYVNLFSELSENPTSNKYLSKITINGQNKNPEPIRTRIQQQPLTIPTEWEYKQFSSDELLAELRKQKK